MDICSIHNTPARKTYDYGRLLPQPSVTVYKGCKCAHYHADLPGGVEQKHCRSYEEADGLARFALEIWRAA
jgi:hypothetical protein